MRVYAIMNQAIALIGCGWLGKPLALKLKSKNSQLIVSTGHDRTLELEELGIQSIPIDLSAKPLIPKVILNSDILIYTIPPLELTLIQSFFNQISPDKKIIFTTSTSVYSKDSGEASEETMIDVKTSSSPLLVKTETYLRGRFKNCTIIRPGGLYGIDRHPVFFLAGRSMLNNGDDYLHLASLNDCLNAITKVIELNFWGETVNVVSDLRVTKKDYYTQMARVLNLPDIHYSESESKINNPLKISNEKSKNKLGLQYENPLHYKKLLS